MISYKFKLYNTKQTKHLELMLQEARFVWNRMLGLQKRYYNIFNKYASAVQLQKHYAKRYKRTYLHSQTAQEVIQRLDLAYQRFFKHLAKRPPKFKSKKFFTSFCFKQGGFNIQDNTFTIRSIKKTYKFSKSRDIVGNIKRVCVKRTPLNEYYIIIVTDGNNSTYTKSRNGASVGIDFGLKQYLTLSDGTVINNPQFHKSHLRKLRKLSKLHSQKKQGSSHKERARLALCREYEYISNSRLDFQWKLAHMLCKTYDIIFVEDLNLQGMTRLWGRKMCDLAHSNFLHILEYVATKYDVMVHKIESYYPSSKLCDCGYVHKELKLSDREWVCPHCGQIHDRDFHAAININRRGIYELESNGKTVIA